MDKPAYTLEFEKPLRDLTAQLDALRQQSLENNLDLGSEIAGIKKKIEAKKNRKKMREKGIEGSI